MKYRFPEALKKSPFTIFEKFEIPIFLIILVSGVFLRGWMFGKSGKEFNLVLTLVGMAIVCAICLIGFFLAGGRKLSQMTRFFIFYFAFVPRIKFVYLKRLVNPETLFELRADLYPEKLKNVVALWFPDFTELLLLIIPFVVMMVMAVIVNKEDVAGDKKLKRFFLIVSICSVFFMLLAFPFANISNLCVYIISFMLVALIWKFWEIIRNKKSLEPASIVAWAEILLFTALWLKGIAESIL